MSGQGDERERTGPTPPDGGEGHTARPARPSPALHATVSMKDLAGSFRAAGTGR